MELIGFFFITVFGCLGHFIFEWSGHRKWAGIFFAVNESTWEHIKLTIYPSFIWMFVEIAVRGCSTSLVVAQFASMLTMMLLVPGLFYGYTAITKKNWLITDIIVFLLAVAAGMVVFHRVADTPAMPGVLAVISAVGIALILVMYFRFSYHPPHNFLFRDPINNGFGPGGHDCHSHFHKI